MEQIKPEVKGYMQVSFLGETFKGEYIYTLSELEAVIQEDMEIAQIAKWDYSKNKSKFRPVYQ